MFAGIIYLQSIVDTRLGAAGISTLKYFASTSGEDFFEKTVLATTMWDKVSQDKDGSEQREKEFKNSVWKEYLDKGAVSGRSDNSKTSCENIIRKIVDKNPGKNPGKPTTMPAPQHELAFEKRDLKDTSVGKACDEKMMALEKRYEEKLRKATAALES